MRLRQLFVFLCVSMIVAPAPEVAAQAREGAVRTDDGVDLYYRIVGSGPNVVVIPVAVWLSPQFDDLATAERRVVYYDPRGRGRSGVGDLSAASLDRSIRDLEMLRSALGLDRMALVGWSGYGLETAAYALAYPSRVSRLVQLNPVPPRQEPYMSKRNSQIPSRVDAAAWKTFQDMSARGASERDLCLQQNRALAPAFFAKPLAAHAIIDRLCGWPNEWSRYQGKYFDAFLPSLAKLDLRPRLSELRMPRLIIHGDRDLIELAGVREWLTGHDDVRLLVIAGADHGSFLDAPEIVTKAIDSFLSGSWPSGAVAK